MIRPEVNRYYRHRHGGIYIVVEIAESTIDNSKWVVYNHVYPFEYKTWIRPLDEWSDGRFQLISGEEYNNILLTTVAADYREMIKQNKENSKR